MKMSEILIGRCESVRLRRVSAKKYSHGGFHEELNDNLKIQLREGVEENHY